MTNSNRTLSMVKIVDLKGAIDNLMLSESQSVAIVALCEEFKKLLDSGKQEHELCEKFVVELSKIAESEKAKEILGSLNESVKTNAKNIKLANSVTRLYNSSCKFIAPMLESRTVDYMINKTPETRKELCETLSVFASEPVVKDIIETAVFEGNAAELGVNLVNVTLLESADENKEKTYTESEVDAIIADRLAEAKAAEEAKPRKTIASINTHIGLSGVITNILEKNGSNEKLRAFCEQYVNALNSGKPEETLYEGFISGISNWNYLSAVDTELSALSDRISKYKQDIDLKKILKIMEQTASYFIVPLIEEVVVDYVNEKSITNRELLLQRLESFEYDPFVRDIMNVVNRDLSIENGVYLGESLSLANKYVHTEDVFSPVNYIKENETVFNVKGTYYRRTDNEVNKLSRQEVAALSESFKNLCALVNSECVKISEALNTITIYEGRNKAVISESEINVNGKKVEPGEIDSLINKAPYLGEGSQAFYSAIKVLNENFDNIANINFVKRVAANDRSGKAVDVFKIDNNIFVNTIDESLGRSVYYKNVNPIQCRNYINEHMGINISSLFEDVLPDQGNLAEARKAKAAEFEDYIESLEDKKNTLIKMKDESSDVDDIDDVIKMIDKEIEDTKADYKKFQQDADEFENGKDSDKEDSLKNEVPSDDDEKSDDEKSDDGSHEDSEKESPEEMEQPLTGDEGSSEAPAEDEFSSEPDEYADVPEFDSDFDVPAPVEEPEQTGETVPSSGVVPSPVNSYQVLHVSYNKNVKSGKLTNKGEVIVVIPSVDANGDVHDDMRKVTFYLDANNKPVINNEYMPLDMYYSICDAIENTPETKSGNFDNGDEPTDPQTPETPAPVVPEPETPVDNTPEPTAPAANDTPAEGAVQDSIEGSDASDTEASSETHTEGESTNEVPAENSDAEQQTPAEVQSIDAESAQYPITIGLYHDEFAPRSVSDFEKDLDDMKIEHSQSEGASDEICLKIRNKAQAHALRGYFKDWMNYTDEEFDTFCPELIKCFHNKQTDFPVGPKNEGVAIKKVKANVINEGENHVDFSILVPGTKEYCKLLEMEYDPRFEKRQGMMRIIAENKNEAQVIYNRLYLHSLKNKNIDQDVVDILEHYAPEYKTVAEKSAKYDLSVPYNGFLESKLEANGFKVNRLNEDKMSTSIYADQFGKAKKVLESFYGEAAPTEARDFFQTVNEAVHITIKDDSTGKTVEINTDDLNGTDAKSQEEGSADFDSSFKDTTFDMKDSMVFKDDAESSDDEDEDKEKEKKEEDKEKKESKKNDEKADESLDVTETEEGSNEEEKSEDGEGSEESKKTEKSDSEDSEKEKEQPKKKFKFRASKKAKNESVNNNGSSPSLNENLNESAAPTILDLVDTPSGRGQIIYELADGSFIVNVCGHTLNYQKGQVKMLNERPDTVDFPWKIDPVTLKAIFESYVNCGMFINNMRITSDDCRVKLNEYDSAKPDDEVNVILEGKSTKIVKKYLRITENLLETLDVNNYAAGKVRLSLEEGLVDADAYVNRKDFNTYKNINESMYPVRVIVKLDENAKMIYANGASITLNESEDYMPSYAKDLKNAIALTIK